MLNPVIVGKWESSTIWLQWDAQESGVKVRLRMRPGERGALMEVDQSQRMEWGGWRNIVTNPRKPGWLKVPVHRSDWDIQAQLSVDGQSWETAKEAVFGKSRCKFLIESEEIRVISEGSIIAAVVDGAVCSYKIASEIKVQPGAPVEVDLESEASTPWAQIDNTGDFSAKILGCTIRNLSISSGGLGELTGRDFTTTSFLTQETPVRIARR
jgi:hypothetical protein